MSKWKDQIGEAHPLGTYMTSEELSELTVWCEVVINSDPNTDEYSGAMDCIGEMVLMATQRRASEAAGALEAHG